MSSIVRRAGSKLLRLLGRATDPATEAGRALVYSKDDIAGIAQVFARTDDGTVYQITPAEQAAWPIATIRYFAVDYDGGLDSNDGFSDVSMAAAGLVALKTLERLEQIFPKFGNGRKAVVAIKSRAGGLVYRNIANTADDDLDFLNDVYGYEHLLVRATDTIATASSVAFANDLADKIGCGARIVPGTNVPGYNPAGVPTTSVFDCVLAGGGAPGLPAEPGIIGKRIRFDSATTTVALRNVCASIWMNDTDTITVGTNLPAVPVVTDVFYIEEPGVAVNRIIAKSANPNSVAAPPSFALQGIIVAGVRTVAVAGTVILIRGPSNFMSLAFCETPTVATLSVSVSGIGDFRLLPTYNDELATPTVILVGPSLRCDGFTVGSASNVSATNYACIVFRPQILNCTQFSIGSASYALTGALIQGCGLGAVATTAASGGSVGNGGSATNRPYRVLSPFAGTILSIIFTNVVLDGIDATGAGVSPLIRINAVGVNVRIDRVTGSTGNTGPGLDLTAARDCNVLMGTLGANTFTGAAGQDIQGAGPVFYVHADYARTDLRDAHANHVQGTGLSIVGVTTRLINDAVADIGQYKIVRATGSGVVQAALATTPAGAGGIVGVSQSPFTAAGPQGAMHVNGGATWTQFDAAPTAGDIAYLSEVTAGNAKSASPPAVALNQRIRLGRVMRVSGTLGLVAWHPENLSVLSDGLP